MLGDKIKYLRTIHNLTQAELAQKLKITRSALSLYELNRRSPDNDILIIIADFFSVTTDYLLGKEEKKENYIENPLNDLSPENREKALEYIKMLKVIDEVNNSKNMTIDKDAK